MSYVCIICVYIYVICMQELEENETEELRTDAISSLRNFTTQLFGGSLTGPAVT